MGDGEIAAFVKTVLKVDNFQIESNIKNVVETIIQKVLKCIINYMWVNNKISSNKFTIQDLD